MQQSKFPKGWNEERVLAVLSHYENQTEEEAVAEDERVAAILDELKRHVHPDAYYCSDASVVSHRGGSFTIIAYFAPREQEVQCGTD